MRTPLTTKIIPLLGMLTILGGSPGLLFADAAVTAAAAPPTVVMPTDAAEASHLTDAAKLIYDCLVQMSEKSSDKDTQYYEDGHWHFAKEAGAEEREGGPARAAATLWNWQAHALASGVLPAALQPQATPEKQAWLHRVAVDTFTRLIKDFQNPGGWFGPDQGTPRTYFFAVELVSTYLQLQDSLDPQTKQLWLDTLTRELDYLVAHGDLPDLEKGKPGWYVNGNIDLGEAELIYKMWKATGNPKYKQLFEAQWNHTLQPSEPRWKGYGLFYEHEPTKPDGSDGAGYLAESGGGTPGFDPSYTSVQLNVCGSLYVASRDPRTLRLMNLLLNMAMTRVDQNLWTYDASSGSRKNYKGMFTSLALPIAAYQGGRDDLKGLVAAQFKVATKGQYWGNAVQNWGHPNFYLGMGTELAVLLEPYIPVTAAK